MSIVNLNFQEIVTAFMVLFAVIDITGSIPIILHLKSNGNGFQPFKATIISLLILIGFLFAGEALLKLFNTDIASFAIAGSLILFALALEMTFNIELFKNDNYSGKATIVPIVFPLVAGPGTLTTALSLRAEIQMENIIIAILCNLLLVYFVLKKVRFFERILGQNGIAISRKFFGVILIAMSVKLFISNLRILLQ
jgi:multiple antibiotic resistance protein